MSSTFSEFIFKLFEQKEKKSISGIYRELVNGILDKFGYSEDNYPTAKWISGKLNQQIKRYHEIEQSLESGKVTDPDILKGYRKYKFLVDLALDNGLVSINDKGRYGITKRGSKFIQTINSKYSDFNLRNWKETRKTMLHLDGEVAADWAANLPPESKSLLKIYSELTAKDYSFLKGLLAKKEGKKSYIDVVQGYRDSNPEQFEILQHNNLIKDDYSFNFSLFDKMLTFLDSLTKAQLRNYNREITFTTERIAALKALARNKLAKMTDERSSMGKPDAVQARKFLDSVGSDPIATKAINDLVNWNVDRMTGSGKKKFPTSSIAFWKENSLINNSNELTRLGTAVVGLSAKNVNQHIDKDESNVVKSRLPDDFEDKTGKLQQRNRRTVDRNLNFSSYLNK